MHAAGDRHAGRAVRGRQRRGHLGVRGGEAELVHAHRRVVADHQVGADAEERALPEQLGRGAAGAAGHRRGRHATTTAPSFRYLLRLSSTARVSSAVPVSGSPTITTSAGSASASDVDDPHPVGDPAAQAGDVVAEQVGGAALAGDQGQRVAGQQRLDGGGHHGRGVVGADHQGRGGGVVPGELGGQGTCGARTDAGHGRGGHGGKRRHGGTAPRGQRVGLGDGADRGVRTDEDEHIAPPAASHRRRWDPAGGVPPRASSPAGRLLLGRTPGAPGGTRSAGSSSSSRTMSACISGGRSPGVSTAASAMHRRLAPRCAGRSGSRRAGPTTPNRISAAGHQPAHGGQVAG